MQHKWGYLIVVVFVLALQGCETVKGAANGAAEGFSKDTEDWKNKDTAIHKVDNWMREHMW